RVLKVKGVVDGVAYLHSRVPPVIHGDIHYHNILITGSGDALICDFGLSRIRHMIPRTNTQFSEGGHIRFTAPEITSGQIMLCNEASDIYSLAMTIYSLGVGKPPLYHVPGDQRAVRLMEHGERPSYLPGSRMDAFCGPNDAIVPDIWRLLERMWVQEPRDRPGA
ncbi:kinase-like protein, partial [Clavulina sp. PMI_390]